MNRAAMLVVGIAATTAACGPPASAGLGTVAGAPAPPPVGCRATVTGIEVWSWREIAAEGFTFCVPPDWRGSGRTLRRGGAEITWGKGTRPPQHVAVVTETVAVPASADMQVTIFRTVRFSEPASGEMR